MPDPRLNTEAGTASKAYYQNTNPTRTRKPVRDLDAEIYARQLQAQAEAQRAYEEQQRIQREQQRQYAEYLRTMLNNEALRTNQAPDEFGVTPADRQAFYDEYYADNEPIPLSEYFGLPEGQTFGDTINSYMYPTVAANAFGEPGESLNNYFNPLTGQQQWEDYYRNLQREQADNVDPYAGSSGAFHRADERQSMLYGNNPFGYPDWYVNPTYSVLPDEPPPGGIGVEDEGEPYYGSGYGYNQPTYNYPRYTSPEQVKNWYENMLQWKIS